MNYYPDRGELEEVRLHKIWWKWVQNTSASKRKRGGCILGCCAFSQRKAHHPSMVEPGKTVVLLLWLQQWRECISFYYEY